MKRSADATFDIPEASSSSITLSEAHSPAESAFSDVPPPRKRARSDLTTEERKEARAHRNRIAAQNSRDRRKAQFTFLERRVSELEEENRQLKANTGLTQLHNTSSSSTSDEPSEREKARERENEELRERIKTLENGWDAVVKALAASGLPLQIPTPSAPNTESSSLSSNTPNTFPVMTLPSPTFPLTPVSSTSTSSPNSERDFDEFESTRHLARVATTDAPPLSSVPLPRVVSQRTNFNSSSSPLLPLIPSHHPTSTSLPQQSLKARQSLHQPMKLSCKTSSVRYLRRVPTSRRRLCLLLLPPAKSPPNRPSRTPRWHR
ncbi:hypothetical protein QCA50_003978 [Cerrena zonata]|uniref:X-box-binding protein 1 n=1 Tax=Cerrena zonata TaxID=2478898 RepID=A0AAW0GFN0_9APHY